MLYGGGVYVMCVCVSVCVCMYVHVSVSGARIIMCDSVYAHVCVCV